MIRFSIADQPTTGSVACVTDRHEDGR